MGGWSPPSTGSRRNSGGSATAERIVSPHSDGWIKILDLSPLLAVTSLEPAQPVLLSHFPISLPSSQPTIPTSTNPGTSPFTTISALSFSPSGTLLAASDQDGCVLRVFSVRGPIPSTIEAPSSRRSSASSASRRRTSFRSSRQSEEHAATSGPVPSPVWHTYDLVRGVTRGTIESVVWGLDSRWVGFVSGRGTFRKEEYTLTALSSFLTLLSRPLPHQPVWRPSRRRITFGRQSPKRSGAGNQISLLLMYIFANTLSLATIIYFSPIHRSHSTLSYPSSTANPTT
jgi:hypothetical protein